MNLNFDKFTLKTGFVVQGHIYFFIRVVGAWRLLLQDCRRLGWFYVEKKCTYVTDGWAEERLVHIYRAWNMSASSPAADLGCGWWPRCCFCQCQLSDTASVSLCTSLFLFIRYEIQQVKISFWFSCLSSSLPFVPFTWFMYKNNICINCLKWDTNILKFNLFSWISSILQKSL